MKICDNGHEEIIVSGNVIRIKGKKKSLKFQLRPLREENQGGEMIKEVYEKYKHLDPMLSEDSQEFFLRHILFDLWKAIKSELNKGS